MGCPKAAALSAIISAISGIPGQTIIAEAYRLKDG